MGGKKKGSPFDYTDEAKRRGIQTAMGVAWYTRESYDRCMAIFEDAADLPDTFHDWKVRVQQIENDALDKGLTLVRVVIDPETFPAWCAANGHNIDGEARLHFGSLKAKEWIETQQKPK